MKVFNKNPLRLVLITTIIITTSFIMLQQMNMTTVKGHNKNATPTEIFSLWNNTSPTIDGTIDFNSSSLSTEWSASAIYNLYDNSESLDSKILLQNDNTNLYVALDMTTFQTEVPVTIWGAAIYIDRDHNGLLSSYDRAIIFKENSTGQFVLYCYFSNSHNTWIELDDSIPGVAFGSNIKMDTSFDGSFFEQTNHRQYEFRIPFAEMNSGPGKITGIGFEAFTNYQGNDEELTWPFVSSTPSEMRTSAGFFGDIYFGKDTGLGNYYAEYAIEENTNIKSDALGINSGLFLGTADIDGNGDLELIVSSNVTDSSLNYLLAVYDFSNGVLTQNWSSWTTSHQSKMFAVKSIAACDFDEDGKDEIYVVGEDSRILRFSDWDSELNDFESSSYVYSHTSSLTGYIAIGDGNNDGSNNLVFGDQNGYVNVLVYNLGLDSFSQDKRSPFTVNLLDDPLSRVHAVAVGDSDDDLENEILFLGQTSADNLLSPTSLYIYLKSAAKYLDNPEDDLPSNSIATTEDRFGHTILVADVDNDLETEIIIIGKDYIRIFRKDTFTDPTPPFELTLTDGISNPAMGGGAEIADIDNDGMNELIFGASNGTIYVMNLTKEGTGEYSFQLEWSGDIGSSPGKRSSIKVFDIDSDSESEIVLGDNFGQLLILGRTNPPEVTINTPTPGSTFSSSPIYVEWSASDDFALHHFDIYVGSNFIGRTPGCQISYFVPLSGANNLIKVVAFDVTGKNSSATVNVGFTTSAPEIQITSPDNYLLTQNSIVTIEFANFDPNDDFFQYCIWVNDVWQVNQSTTEEDSYLLTMPVDGLYNITIVGVDLAKNIGKNSIFITRDNTDPNIGIYSPISHSYVLSSEITLRWTASDSLSGIDYFEIYKDTIYEASTTSLSYLVSLDIDKEYTFEVIAYDIVGNSDSSIIYVNRDTIQPKVTILSPTDGLISASSSLLLSWDAEDNIDGSSIHHSEVVVNQLTAYYGTAESTTINLGEDGLKDILVTTYDRAGNSRTDYISVIVDQNNPILVITSPYDEFTTGLDIVPLSWESYDNGTGIANYEIFVNGLSIENITDTSITEWLVPVASNQNSTITIRASDYANHFYEDSITIVQNSLQPTISLLDPIEPFSYYPETQFDIHWEIANIVNHTGFDIYVNGSLLDSFLDINLRTYLVDLGILPIDEYPIYNLTVVATTTNSSVMYGVTHWFIIDQSDPFLTILTPSNNSVLTVQGSYIQWTGFDFGSGVAYYSLSVNDQIDPICFCERIYHYLTFDFGDGLYSIKVVAFDYAGNNISKTILVNVYVLSPEFSTNITSIFYTSTGEFQFNFTITDPQLGVKSFIIKMDDNTVLNAYYYESMLNTSYSLLVNITSIFYDVLEGEHELLIGVVDSFNHETTISLTIIVDNEAPNIVLDLLTVDSQFIYGTTFDLELDTENPLENNHTITVTITDNTAIATAFLEISGQGYYKLIEMTRIAGARLQTSTYTVSIDLNELSLGEYNITIRAIDYAGNSYEIMVIMNVIPLEAEPWYMQGLNIFYLSGGILLFALLTVITIITSRRTAINKNWEDEIIAVIYVRNTGLTCAFAPYSPKLIQEEQLIGGAMIAIQSILDEISGENGAKRRVETLEIGTKSLMLFSGQHGYGALIVKDVKPKHKELLEEFTIKFEKVYSKSLQAVYYVDSTAFAKAIVLIEEFFGPVKGGMEGVAQEGLAEQLRGTKEEHEKSLAGKVDEDLQIRELLEDKTPLDILLEGLPKESRNQLIRIIEIAPKVIISLVEIKLDEAEKQADDISESLEFLLKAERSNRDLMYFVQSVISLMKDIHDGIIAGRNGDTSKLQTAVEKASKLWFEDIAEKWSDVS